MVRQRPIGDSRLLRSIGSIFALAALAAGACARREPTPPEAAPAAVVDAAPSSPGSPPPPFDFRAVALDPVAFVGTTQRCEVGHVDAPPPPAPAGVVRVHCGNGYRLVPVEVSLDAGAAIGRREIVQLRITGGPSPGRDAAATATLVAHAGMLEAPAPVSQCECRDDATGEQAADRAAAEARLSSAYDFRAVATSSTDGGEQLCLVDREPWELSRTDPGAPAYTVAARFPPDVAAYAARVTCQSATGSATVIVGFRTVADALRLQDGMLARLALHHVDGDPAPTALFVGIAHDVAPIYGR